jgi:methyl-accepting chemotaxis protein
MYESLKPMKNLLFLKLFLPVILIIAISLGGLITLSYFSYQKSYKQILTLDPNSSKQNIYDNSILTIKKINELHKRNTIIIILIASFLLIIALVYWQLKLIQPLRKLIKMTSELKDGNLVLEFKMNSNDEIGKLAGVIEEISNKIIGILEDERLLKNTTKNIDKIVSELAQIKEGQLYKLSAQEDGSLNVLIENLNNIIEDQKNIVLNIKNKGTEITDNLFALYNWLSNLAKYAEKMGIEIEKGSNNLIYHKDKITKLNKHINATKTKSNEVLKLINHTNGQMHNAINATNNLDKLTKEDANRIQFIEINFKELENYVKKLSELLSETTILSLNISIEAAKNPTLEKTIFKGALELRDLVEKTSQLISLCIEKQDAINNILRENKENKSKIGEDLGFIKTSIDALDNQETEIKTIIEKSLTETLEAQNFLPQANDAIDQILTTLKNINEHAKKESASYIEIKKKLDELTESSYLLYDLIKKYKENSIVKKQDYVH